MSVGLKVRNISNQIVVDSAYITMGLVKSGNMVYIETRQRYYQQYKNSPTMYPFGRFDEVYGLTVRASAPIVFIHGRGVCIGSVENSGVITYYYAGASTNTQYWVFDKMSNRGAGAKLRVRATDGTVTFDSSQPPLNILTSVTPPLPEKYSPKYGGNGSGYVGGSTYTEGPSNGKRVYGQLTVASIVGKLAVHCPWSRAATHTDPQVISGSTSAYEGCYGGYSSVTFCFCTESGAYYNPWVDLSLDAPAPKFYGIPIDRVPSSTVIEVSNLPFPYDVT